MKLTHNLHDFFRIRLLMNTHYLNIDKNESGKKNQKNPTSLSE